MENEQQLKANTRLQVIDLGLCALLLGAALMSPAVAEGRVVSLDTARAYVPLTSNVMPTGELVRYKGAHGGRGSAKSHFFAELLVDESLDASDPMRAVCIREVQVSLKQSVKLLLEDKINAMGVARQFRIMETCIQTPGDGIIIFQGMQNHTAESLKSLEGYKRAWVEEAQSLSERSLTLLRPTIRWEDRKTGQQSQMWFSWNPRHKTDPVDKFLRADPPSDAVVVGTTYRDNPWFPDVLRKEMEWDRKRDKDTYAHVWLGDYEQHSEARVFKNWQVEAFETPKDARFLFGADWGFANDPTTLIRCFAEGRKLYLDYEAFKVGCEVDHTPALFDALACEQMHFHAVPCTVAHPFWKEMKEDDLKALGCKGSHCDGMARGWEIVADSARPETISFMGRHGYRRIVPARKGPGSVEEGVKFLQSYDIVIHPRCVHTVDEFTHYSFQVHPLTGVVVPVLEDKKNHIIDPTRYATEKLRGRRPGDYGVTI